MAFVFTRFIMKKHGGMKSMNIKRFIKTAPAVLAAAGLFACTAARKDSGGQAGTPGIPPAAITVEVFDRGSDGGKSNPVDNKWTAWIQEKLLKDENIAITFVPVPRNDEIPALNNMMAAGTAPDLCFTYTASLIDSYRDQGGLREPGPYVDTALKDLKAFLGPDPGQPGTDLIRRYEDRATGKLYAIPARRVDTASGITFIRKDWLDKLGLPIPESTQQFSDTLAAFKEQDPGGLGKERVIPFTMLTFNSPAGGLLISSFIDPGLSEKDRWIYSNSFHNPGEKEGYRYLNRMYSAGLIDRDFPLYKNESDWHNLIKTGAAGSFMDLWYRPISPDSRIMEMLRENVPGAEFIAIDPFKNAGGITRKSSYDVTGVLSMVPASSKNPEAALRYLNWLSRFENMNFLQIGPEGITHSLADGIPRVTSVTGPWIMNSPNNLDYTLPVNGLELGDPERNSRAFAFSYPGASPEWIINARSLAARNARPDPFVPVTLTAGLPYVQTLADKSKTLIATVITARPADFDRVWDAAAADFLASGAQAIINEKRAKWIE
jgi:putative aldouronate transport system substrate-binding protein